MRESQFMYDTFYSVSRSRYGCYFVSVIFKFVLWIDILSASYKIVVRWMPQNFINDKSAFFQLMAWCCQATIITWVNVDPDVCLHMVSQGHSELTCSDNIPDDFANIPCN